MTSAILDEIFKYFLQSAHSALDPPGFICMVSR